MDDKITRRNFKSSPGALMGLGHGKVPPQSVNLEETVLGALLLEANSIPGIIEILTPEMFYRESNQKIYSAIYGMFTKGEPIDTLTVVNELKNRGELEEVGGAYNIAQLTNNVSSTTNTEYHSRIIIQKFIQRELISNSSFIIREAYEDTTDPLDLLNRAVTQLIGVMGIFELGKATDMPQLVHEVMEKIRTIKEKGVKDFGHPTLIGKLDRIIKGLREPDVITIASRPGMGKTAFLITLVRNLGIKQNIPVAVFSLEMSSQQLINRILSQMTGISAERITNVDLTDGEMATLETASKVLSESPIHIDDTPALTIVQLRAKALKLKHSHDIKVLFIDYVQLMSGLNQKSQNREAEISEISRGIKALAKDLNIPIVDLAQLSRKVEDRGGDKRPKLSDLRESGALEQDSDIVMFLYRYSYYKIDKDSDGVPIPEDLAEIIVEKHRNGACGVANIRFISYLMKFTDWEDADEVIEEDMPF